MIYRGVIIDIDVWDDSVDKNNAAALHIGNGARVSVYDTDRGKIEGDIDDGFVKYLKNMVKNGNKIEKDFYVGTPEDVDCWKIRDVEPVISTELFGRFEEGDYKLDGNSMRNLWGKEYLYKKVIK